MVLGFEFVISCFFLNVFLTLPAFVHFHPPEWFSHVYSPTLLPFTIIAQVYSGTVPFKCVQPLQGPFALTHLLTPPPQPVPKPVSQVSAPPHPWMNATASGALSPLHQHLLLTTEGGVGFVPVLYSVSRGWKEATGEWGGAIGLQEGGDEAQGLTSAALGRCLSRGKKLCVTVICWCNNKSSIFNFETFFCESFVHHCFS